MAQDKYSIYDFSTGPTETGLRVGHWNVQGLGLASDETKKRDYVECLINRHCFHIFAVAETMLQERIRRARTDIEGFSCERLDREMRSDGTREKASGGIMVYIHENFEYVKIKEEERDGNLQYMIVRVSKPVQVDIVVVYNPPNVSYAGRFTSYLNFFTEIKKYFRYPVVVLGDINIDRNDLGKYPKIHVDKMEKTLADLKLAQQVKRITRLKPGSYSGAILDHIYTSQNLKISECDVMRINESDHDIVYCVLFGTVLKSDIENRCGNYEKSLKRFEAKKKTEQEVRQLLYEAKRWAQLTKKHAREVDVLRAELEALSLM